MMEMLQTIWTALTTENAELTSMVIIPLAFIEVFISMLLFSVILNIKVTKKQGFIYVLSITLYTSLPSSLFNICSS